MAVVLQTSLSTITTSTRGDTIHYPDQAGQSVFFQFISETHVGVGPLFGAPVAEQDQLRFSGFGFAAQAVNDDVAFQNGRLDVTIQSQPGQAIQSIQIFEMGSLFLFGPQSTVISSAVANAIASDGVHSASMMISQNGAAISPWQTSMNLTFDSVDKVRLVLDSQLLAFAGVGEAAFIDKGEIRISVQTVSAVPEPGMAVFAVIALVSIPWLGARRRENGARRTGIE